MTTQEKLKDLSNNFQKLDENRKEHILDLTRKLVNIHNSGKMWGKCAENARKQDENSGVNPV